MATDEDVDMHAMHQDAATICEHQQAWEARCCSSPMPIVSECCALCTRLSGRAMQASSTIRQNPG